MDEMLAKLENKTREYANIYPSVVTAFSPSGFDKFLNKIGCYTISLKRRINRFNKIKGSLDIVREQAIETASETLSTFKDVLTLSIESNKSSIGEMERSKIDLNIKREEIKNLFKYCSGTITFLKKHNAIKLPDKIIDWSKIPYEPENPNDKFTVSEMVKHQRQWTKITKAITEDEELVKQLKTAKQAFEHSSAVEQKCERYISKFESEIIQLPKRFEVIESALQLGELTSINEFPDKEIEGTQPLNNLLFDS